MPSTIVSPPNTERLPQDQTFAPAATSVDDNIVAVRHFTKRYGSTTVVEDVSFSLPRGHVVGLIGPNGAGKTTIMKSLVGLVSPSGGDIDILDTQVGAPGWGRALTRVGTMIEAPPLYHRMTAYQNLAYQQLALGQKIDGAKIAEILELVGLSDEHNVEPRKFSLGMKQRLGIGITLIGDPELVILDEPANGLDPAGILQIRNLLRQMPERGTSVLVSSHQLAEVQQACDSLVILDHGRIVTTGTTEEIVSRHNEHAFVVTARADDRDAAYALLVEAGLTVEFDLDELVVRPPAEVTGRDLIRLLTDNGCYPEAVTPKSSSLESAFLNLTTGR